MENNLNNLPPFYVGQKVVYITGINMTKNSIHTVTDVKIKDCGCWQIGINGIDSNSENIKEFCYCKNCGAISHIHYYNGWNPQSFRPLQESVFPSLTMSKVVEKESQLISMN